MTQSIVVQINREQTYRHLFSLCQNDSLFAISDYGDNWQEEDFERIVISDAQALISGAHRAVIGTIRLLPYDNNTTVMFVNKDAIWHSDISESGEKLFLRFIERVTEHFTKLDLVYQKSTEVLKVNKDDKSGKEHFWKMLISIILLSIALAGFIWLPWYSSILWLIFFIVAYPVALAITSAKQSMDNRNLIEIYKAGLTQVPVLGKFFLNKLSS